MYINLTDYRVYVGTKDCLINTIKDHLLNGNGKLNIVSGNPEVLFNGLNNEELKRLFDREDNIIIPDGVGVTFLVKLLKRNNVHKIAGIDVMEEVLKICSENGLKVYFVGATEENINLAVNNINKKYASLDIVGFRNGYFKNDKDVIDCINSVSPDVLFVAMGSPKQDLFISKCMDSISCKFFMGVGGSIDLYAGKLSRAPRWMINLGLEWLYRVYKEPFRIKRLSSIPKFMLKSVKYHLKDRYS